MIKVLLANQKSVIMFGCVDHISNLKCDTNITDHHLVSLRGMPPRKDALKQKSALLSGIIDLDCDLAWRDKIYLDSIDWLTLFNFHCFLGSCALHIQL